MEISHQPKEKREKAEQKGPHAQERVWHILFPARMSRPVELVRLGCAVGCGSRVPLAAPINEF